MTFNWLNIVTHVLPVALAVIPGMPPTLVPVIVHGITEAESMAVSGADKKLHVMNMVNLAIEGINMTQREPVLDKDKVIPIVDVAIDTAIVVTNALSKARATR